MPHEFRASTDMEPTRVRRQSRRRAALLAIGGVIAVLVIALATVLALSGDDAVAKRPAVTTTTSTTSPPELPVPEPPPEDEYEDVPVTAIGTIEIPKLGLVHELYTGIWLTVLDRGPGLWPGTAEPGGYGNSVIAGHRVTNSRPFHDIDQLESGDEIVVTTDAGRFVYRLTGAEVVDPVEGMRIVDQAPGHAITLFACHPPGSAAYRYVVVGELVSETLEELRAARPPVGSAT